MPDDPAPLILAALGEVRWPRGPAEIAARTGLPQKAVGKVLERLADAGQVQRVRIGQYTLPVDPG
jgi:DNA-binding IclR family transcriptional regulator